MYKCVEEFFKNNQVNIPRDVNLEDTDLYLYLKLAYGSMPYYDNNNGLIAVIKEPNSLLFVENVFYDYTYKSPDFYINIPGLNIQNSKIKNCKIGHNLSKRGYCFVDIPSEYQQTVLHFFPSMSFKRTPVQEGLQEPYATRKFKSVIWSNEEPEFKNTKEQFVYSGMKILMESSVQFSEVLKAMNAFDMNILQWKKGRSMQAHNGVDYRSFVNLITYNTNYCLQTRDLAVGEYNWYDVVFECLVSENFEPLMDINQNKKEYERLSVRTSKGVLVNVFNPKFYHQVGEMKGEGDLYVSTANMSFKSIVDKFDFKW